MCSLYKEAAWQQRRQPGGQCATALYNSGVGVGFPMRMWQDEVRGAWVMRLREILCVNIVGRRTLHHSQPPLLSTTVAAHHSSINLPPLKRLRQ